MVFYWGPPRDTAAAGPSVLRGFCASYTPCKVFECCRGYYLQAALLLHEQFYPLVAFALLPQALLHAKLRKPLHFGSAYLTFGLNWLTGETWRAADMTLT